MLRDSARPSVPLPKLTLSLQFADASARAILPRAKVRRWIQIALERPAQMAVRIVGASEGQCLNAQYRGKNHATNVLTFDYESSPVVWADLILCAPVVASEAADLGLPLVAHYAHLIVHGALHAQGYDHVESRQARKMESRESELLLRLGFADPYDR